MTCAHENFSAKVSVARIKKGADAEVTQYMAEVKVKCRECKTPFSFVGLAIGESPRFPMASVDGTKLRAPITPINSTPDLDGPGFSVNVFTKDESE